ncbi:hypothetical protein [Geoglobus acetivorans]|uniref:Uncharacterized protein n=1 Tax=Geoglobus acetivorans TaxID=565033 RepID=A0A0A7GHE7_GEOAI|nr:hypothetical protein GACE_1280 [Geoglobus acetivorans]
MLNIDLLTNLSNHLSNTLVLAIITALLTALVNQWWETSIKRKNIIGSLKNHETVRKLISHANFYPTKTIFILIMLYVLLMFLIPIYEIYGPETFNTLIHTPIKDLDDDVPARMSIWSSFLLLFFYLTYTVALRVFQQRENFLKKHCEELYTFKVLADALFSTAIAVFIAIFIIEYLKAVNTGIIWFTAVLLILTAIIWSYMYSVNHDIYLQLKNYLITSKLEIFEHELPYVIVSTKSGKAEGNIWNLFDKTSLVLNTRYGSRIYILWNEISWIKVIEPKDQNEVFIKELKKDDSNKSSFRKRVLRLLK